MHQPEKSRPENGGPEKSRPGPQDPAPVSSMSARVLRWCAGNVAVGAAYWLVAVWVRWYFSRYQMSPAPIWLSAGVAMFAVFSMGGWVWPGIFVGSWLAGTISFGESASWTAVVAGGNAIAPVVAVGMMRGRMGGDHPFSRPAHVFFLGTAALVDGAISAAVGASAVWWKLKAPLHTLPAQWSAWIFSDAGAVVLLVPLFLLLRHNRVSLRRVRRHAMEFLGISAVSAGTVIYLLKEKTGLPAADAGASFLVLVPLLWVAVRFSATIAYPMFVTVMTAVIVATLAGYGPYAGVDQGGTCFIFAQMVIGFGAAVLLLGAGSEQQRTTANALRQLNEELETRVEERTAELRKSKERMEKAALHDPLTGLPNRRLLEQRFGACRAAAVRKRAGLAVLVIDLDHFKEINDNLGHDAGDVILVETGRRLKAAVREYDVVARMGGDEFAVLLPDVEDRAGADPVCTRIVQVLTDRIFFNGRHIVTSPSIGVAFCPQHGDLWQDMYKAADVALYNAKRAGRCRWEWYEPEEAGTVAAAAAGSTG